MEMRGHLMWNALGHSWPTLRWAGSTEEDVKKVLLTGNASVLWNDNGDFILGDAKPWS
jgi:hypothetical protein